MGLRHVYDDVIKHARRQYSDDYDHMEQSICSGSDFGVKIGDVSIRLNHGRYDCTGLSIYVNGVHVMTYRSAVATHARFNDEPSETTWHQDSPMLRQHVRCAASEIYKRHRDQERVREREARARKDKEARNLVNFKERFGIND